MIEADRAVEAQLRGPAREPRDGDAIAEDVMHPTERDRLLVPVGRDVADGEKLHWRRAGDLLPNPIIGSKFAFARNMQPVGNRDSLARRLPPRAHGRRMPSTAES